VSVYKGEVEARSSFSLPAADAGGAFTEVGYGLTCHDIGGSVNYGITVYARWRSYAGPTYEYGTVVGLVVNTAGSNDPFDTLVPGTTYYSALAPAANGGAGIEYASGGILSVEKNTVSGDLTFSHPLGTTTINLLALGVPALDVARAMEPFGMGVEMRLRVPMTGDQDNPVHWNDFWGSVDGVRNRGASLSDVQPGVWGAWTRSFGYTGTPFVLTNTQHTNDYESDFFADTVTFYGGNQDSWYRVWTGGDTIPMMTSHELDMTQAEEHGVIFRAYSADNTPNTLFLGRTHDNGVTWRTVTIHTGAMIGTSPSVVRNPSLAYYGRRLIAVWGDHEHVYQSISSDLGEHWDTPTIVVPGTVGFTPIVPRFVVHPDHGLSYYFHIQQETGNLYLRRSGDFGLSFTDAAPGILLGTAIDAVYVDPWVDDAGYVRVSYRTAGAGVLYNSVLVGNDWTIYDLVGGLLGGNRSKSVQDRGLGLSYHVFFLPLDSSINAFASPDHGVLPTPGPSYTLVEDTLPEQTPALARRSDEGVMIGYYSAVGAIVHRSSKDFARTFD
jgi:hypothetical protein